MKPFEQSALLNYAQMSNVFSNIEMISELHDVLGRKLKESVEEKETVYKMSGLIQTFKRAVFP